MQKKTIKNILQKENKNDLHPVLIRLSSMRDVRGKYDEKWESELKDYQNEDSTSSSEDSPDDYRSSLKIPTLTGLVDTKLADELKLPFIPEFLPEGKDSIPFREIRGKIFDSVWHNIKGNKHRQIALHQKNIFGDSFIMAIWRTETREVKTIVGIDDNNMPVYKSKTIIPYDDIKLFNVEPRYLLFDYSTESINDCMDCAYDRVISKESFTDYYVGNGMFKQEEVQNALKSSSTQYSFETKYEDETREDENMVNLVDYFNVITDTYMVIANGFIIFDGPMPIKMLPFVHYRNRYKTGSFYSSSEKDVIKDIIEEKDVHRNMIIDYNKFNIHSPILTQQGVEFDEENYEFGPGIIWRVGDTNAVRRLPMPNIINAPFETESMFDADITKVSGVDINALISDSSESATKTISKKRNQLSRLEPMMKYNSYTADERLVTIIMEYVDTYYSLPRASTFLDEDEMGSYKEYREARVEDYEVVYGNGGIEFKEKKGGIDFFDITPETLNGKFTVRVSTQDDIPVSKELKEQKALELLQIMNAIPLDEQGKMPPHIQPIVKMLLESGDFNKKDYENLFTDKEEGVDPTREQLSGLGVEFRGNQTPGRVPTPQETQQSFGQRGVTNISNGAELGQVTATNAGV